MCQRYYWRIAPTALLYPVLGRGQCTTTTSAAITVNHPVPFRVPATAVETSGNTAHYSVGNAAMGLLTLTNLTFGTGGESTVLYSWLNASVSAGLVAGNATSLHAYNTTAAYLGFSAEL